MANTFKNQGAALTTGGADVYTAPGSTESIIHSCIISNIHATDSATVDLYLSRTLAIYLGVISLTISIASLGAPSSLT